MLTAGVLTARCPFNLRPNIALQHDAAKSALVKLFTYYRLMALK